MQNLFVQGGYGGDYCCKEFYLTAESWDNESEHWWTLHSRFDEIN